MYPYLSLKTYLKKWATAFPKFWFPLLLTHPELITLTPYMSPTWFLEIDTFGQVSQSQPQTFFMQNNERSQIWIHLAKLFAKYEGNQITRIQVNFQGHFSILTYQDTFLSFQKPLIKWIFLGTWLRFKVHFFGVWEILLQDFLEPSFVNWSSSEDRQLKMAQNVPKMAVFCNSFLNMSKGWKIFQKYFHIGFSQLSAQMDCLGKVINCFMRFSV